MTDFLAELPNSPSILPQKLDLVQDRVLLIAFSEAEYRAASFLDDRILAPQTKGAWAPFEQVRSAASRINAPSPLHFIFHSGHVGSTLLSRLLDETGSVLGLREPLPLRTLADAGDLLGRPESLLGPTGFALRLGTFLRLWRRGFERTRTVVVKATSSAARLHSRLLAADPETRGIYLNLSAEAYLATLLAGENAVFDLRAHGPERIKRLQSLLADYTPPLHALSPGELAAASWLAERLCQEHAVSTFGQRILPIDFEEFLADPSAHVARVLSHFSIGAPPRFAEDVRQLPVFARYSKAPERFAYSPELRRQVLSRARSEHQSEIAAGLALLERLGSVNTEVAAVL